MGVISVAASSTALRFWGSFVIHFCVFSAQKTSKKF
jgi:hypothetical protein